MKHVYLDNAATTKVRDEVISKMQDALANNYGNPSSTHSYGRTAKTAIESARKTIAKYMNALPSEIIFTSGGTEADNMILRSAVKDCGVKTIITSKIEHHAVLHTVEEMEQSGLLDVLYVRLDQVGNPDLEHLQELLQKDLGKKLVSLMHVNNEIGNLLNIKQVAKMCKEHGALFHSDSVQSIGHYPWDVKEVPVDFLAAAAHKFHGPKGVGFAFIRKNSGLKCLISGGSQERGFRAGTESFHNIVGLEEAFVLAYDNLEKEQSYVKELKGYFVEKIKTEIPGAKFNGLSGSLEESTYTLANVCLPVSPEKGLMLLFHLDIKGIACSKGSACQSGSDSGSHVLNEILSGEDLKKPSLRFSFSKYNTKEEIDYTIGVLKEFTLQ
ncbi:MULTISPECIES: cysteine desulfurase family protein [Maribacter]|uniref:cysteine desulfurase n=1 Tax=Maribacter flavus TaxID=1658664 RepID=A0ABU7IMD7_9FLAO|nr:MULTISPECIES: cysteine desulfurase family protein [Maribacter]MDC6407012.1 cysteine desulfurase family protein [Maribacter sp. PR66]MEE1974127.1 cysteine desulfurase family protein [Maribacter flavus]